MRTPRALRRAALSGAGLAVAACFVAPYVVMLLDALKPALLVAVVLNVIYVFNSFPIVWTLNDRNPGFAHDTMVTYMYKIAFKSALRDVGLAAALGVVNVVLILIAVFGYLRTVRWDDGDVTVSGRA